MNSFNNSPMFGNNLPRELNFKRNTKKPSYQRFLGAGAAFSILAGVGYFGINKINSYCDGVSPAAVAAWPCQFKEKNIDTRLDAIFAGSAYQEHFSLPIKNNSDANNPFYVNDAYGLKAEVAAIKPADLSGNLPVFDSSRINLHLVTGKNADKIPTPISSAQGYLTYFVSSNSASMDGKNFTCTDILGILSKSLEEKHRHILNNDTIPDNNVQVFFRTAPKFVDMSTGLDIKCDEYYNSYNLPTTTTIN